MKKMYKTPDMKVALLEKLDIITGSDGVLPPELDDDNSIGDFEVFGG